MLHMPLAILEEGELGLQSEYNEEGEEIEINTFII